MNFDNIPAALKAGENWVCHKNKIPIDAITGKPASSTNERTWADFNQARSVAHKYDGIGRMLAANEQICGIDLDKCIDAQGNLSDLAQEFLDSLPDTYAEYSPSGRGIHIWCYCTTPLSGCRKGAVEIYQTGRYLTVTGNAIPGRPSTVHDYTAAVVALHGKHIGEQPKPVMPASPIQRREANPADMDVLSLAVKSKSGPKITLLMAGDTSGYASQSEAEFALCSYLAFYAGPNGQGTVDAIYRSSGLYRAKWDERRGKSTIGAQTIARVYATKREFYSPRSNVSLVQEGIQEPVHEQPTPMTSPATPGEVLARIGKRLDTNLRKLGVGLDTCALKIPQGIDREDLEKIGRTLKVARGRIKTLVNFLLADWYCALPNGRGDRKYIIGRIYGLDAPRQQQMMSDYARTARAIPTEYRNPERTWAFYEAVARLPEERRKHWLTLPPQVGETEAVRLELEAAKPHEDIPEKGGNEEETDSSSFGNSKRLTTVKPLLQYGTNTVVEGIEEEQQPASQPLYSTLILPASLLATIEERAALIGMTPPQLLERLLNGEQDDDSWEPTDEDVPPADEDDAFMPGCSPHPCPLVLMATEEQIAQARTLAQQRKEFHDGRRRAGEDRGSDTANLAADKWGVLAEIMIRARLKTEGLEFSVAPLFTDRVNDAPDVTLFGQQFDIKAGPPDSAFLCINDGKHQRHKDVSAGYLTVLFDTETSARIAFVPHSVVNQWERRAKPGREAAAYRSARRADLTPLSSLGELRFLMEQPSKKRTPEPCLKAIYA